MIRAAGWRLLGVGLLLLVINLPLGHAWWVERRLDREGVDVVATVTQAREVPPTGRLFIEYALPGDFLADGEPRLWVAEVDERTFEVARDSEMVRVTVLPGDRTVHRVVGRVVQRFGLWITVAADVMLVGVLVLWWFARRRLAWQQVRIVAVCDVQPSSGEPSFVEGQDGFWLAQGTVLDRDEERVVLDVGETRRVVVELGPFVNQVPIDRPARALGRRPQ
ncbi:hypothetical protein [Nocardioides limicola]|uniref:hypothetical protein n=1 Tax=Nocardioides limicola TaxID=2803368 RepID=UPI00193C7DD9|nr:hypothetical protein [Nocardioides sp. DJM-14]